MILTFTTWIRCRHLSIQGFRRVLEIGFRSDRSFFTLVNSPRSSRTVYAGGLNKQRTLFLLATHDFGDSWQTSEMEDSPREIFVNDIAVVEQGGEEVLFLGTNRGLYSFHLNK